MRAGRILVPFIASAVLLASVAASAAPKLLRPVSVQEARESAIRAAGVENPWRGEHHVTLLGFAPGGRTVMMVKSVDLPTPAIVTTKRTREAYDTPGLAGRTFDTLRSTKLTPRGMSALGLVTPSRALTQAMSSGGLFGDVKGKVTKAGASKDGFAYKFVITPDKPVVVKDRYGVYTVEQLVRMVNVLGQGETAYPAPGKYKWKYTAGDI